MGDTGLSESCPASSLAFKAKQECSCGYLNVKTLQLGPDKRNKDRQWHCYWVQVSDDHLVLYKVDAMSSYVHNSHPPADKECPPKQYMKEMDSIFLSKAIVGLEYTYKVDAKNRRRYLFRITQENGADYLLQAPSDGAAVSWTETLRNIAGRYTQSAAAEVDLAQEMAIRRMRGGEKKAGKAGKGAPINAPFVLKGALPLDPAVIHLKEVLQKKIDLLYHLKEMEKVFSDQQQPRTPSPDVFPQLPMADEDSHSNSSRSETSASRNSRAFERREATILDNYHLIAGAKWSLLHKGERVIILQDLPSGYYLVRALRNAVVKLTTPMKKNVSDSTLTVSNATGGNHSEPTSPTSVRETPVVSILIQQSSDSNLVPSDSFQSNISDDSGIVESSTKRASNLSAKEEDEDKVANETGGIYTESGDDGYEAMLRNKLATFPSSLPASFLAQNKLSPLPLNRITTSQSFTNASEHTSKEVTLPLIGGVPPSVLDCYTDQLFLPTSVKPHASNLSLQQPPKPSSLTTLKKKKQTVKGSNNRLSLPVDNLSPEDQSSASSKRKSSSLPRSDNGISPRSERGKSGIKGFFKKRLSAYGRSSSLTSDGDSEKDLLSVKEELLPDEIMRVQSPVYEYTPTTHSGEHFRRRGQSFVYAIGESSSDSDSEGESESSEKPRSKRKRRGSSDATSSVASSESSTKDENLFEMSLGNNSPSISSSTSTSNQDTKECSDPSSSAEEVVKKGTEKLRAPLRKMKSMPVAIHKEDVEEKRAQRLSVGEIPSVEISMRAPPLNKRRHVYLDANVQKFGFRLETYGCSSSIGKMMDTVVFTVSQGTTAFLAGLYPGDVILEVEGVDVSDKNCNELGSIIASYKKTQPSICLTVKFVDGVQRLNLLKMEQRNQKRDSNRYSTASSDGDSSDTDGDKRLSGAPLSPPAQTGLGRISETTEEESMVEEVGGEDFVPQVISPSQA